MSWSWSKARDNQIGSKHFPLRGEFVRVSLDQQLMGTFGKGMKPIWFLERLNWMKICNNILLSV